MITHAVSITLEAYTRTTQWLGLGEPHPTLVGGELWYPADETATTDRRIFAQLAEQGLTSRRAVSDAFEATLFVTQRAAREYYTYATVNGTSVTIRAAAVGRDAVLMIAADGMLDIEPIPVDQLGSRVVTTLPDTPAARVRPMTCERTLLDALEHGNRPAPGPSVTDAHDMRSWLHLERANVGELHAAIRHQADGERIVTTPPLSCWIDNETGRALLTHADGWVHVTSAGPGEIAQRFGQLEDPLRSRQPT